MNSIIHHETEMTIARRQITDKLYHQVNAFVYLVILQMLGYLLAANGMMSGSGSEHFSYTVHTISSVPLFFFTILWMILQGLHLAGEKSREYYLVSNHFVAYFSDIAVLEIYGVVAGVTLLLAESFLQILASLFYDPVILEPSFLQVGVGNQFILFLTGTLYFLMFGAGAYTVGILRARFKFRFFMGVVLAVLLIIIASMVRTRLVGAPYIIHLDQLAAFYYQETRWAIWLMKMVVTIGLFYGISYLGMRNLEVNER